MTGTASPPAAPTPTFQGQQEALARRVRLLVATTITYNLVEAAVGLTAGAAASSTALVGFGLDSLIEVSSAAAVAWQFAAREHDRRQARERAALRMIAVSFFALAGFVTVDAVRALTTQGEAAHSPVGLGLAALSLLVMPVLSAAQRGAGRQLGSASAVANSKQTLLCSYLSAVLLVGLGLNSAFGWSWADPLAALVIAAVAVKEGHQAWRGDGCCSPAAALSQETAPASVPRTTGGTPPCCADACCACCACRPVADGATTSADKLPTSATTTPPRAPTTRPPAAGSRWY